MMDNPIGWFEIYVQDMSRAKRFCESVFKVKLEKLDNPEVEMWSFPMIHGSLWCIGCAGQNGGLPFWRE